ncbi:MAG: multidrug effflux MFS transporter [Rhizobiaceae bacterium]|nr:MAG: multidrug effflux MFS transporter [Rhizobiaceae bacterium]CAG1010503.1 Bicyclomycin resistance protein [Rhizobiaceae bacterium]
MATTYFDRGSPPHISTLILATSIGSLTMNVFLPSLPGMARYFQTDYAFVQLAVSLYLAATAVLQLFIGPASDRFGRRPVMLFSFTVFLFGTAAAVFAPTIEILLCCRLLQAFSAAGMVLSRAIVRDTVDANEAASRMGYITMGMALVPMIGPMIGGFFDEIYGWKAAFVLTLAFGAVTMAVVAFDLGETNLRRSPGLAVQFATYPALLRSPRFWGYSLTAAFTSGAFFAFIGGGPLVATEMLGLAPSGYGIYFGIISAGYIVGNFLSGRFSGRIGINRMTLAGGLVASGGILLALLLFLAGFHHPLSLFGPAVFLGIGNGITLPNANAGIVSVRPDIAGSASGLGGALQIGGGALLSVVAAALLGPDSGPYPLLWVMLFSSVAAVLTTLLVMRLREQGDRR